MRQRPKLKKPHEPGDNYLDMHRYSLDKLPVTTLRRVRGGVTWSFAAYNLIRIGGIGRWWNPSPT